MCPKRVAAASGIAGLSVEDAAGEQHEEQQQQQNMAAQESFSPYMIDEQKGVQWQPGWADSGEWTDPHWQQAWQPDMWSATWEADSSWQGVASWLGEPAWGAPCARAYAASSGDSGDVSSSC